MEDEALPYELVVMIASQLSPKEVLRLSETSRRLHKICQDRLLWKALFIEKFSSIVDESDDWKALFIQHS